MSIIATIMDLATGCPFQKMTFNRMPKPWSRFNLAFGELVVAEHINLVRSASGKFTVPVNI